MAATQSRPFGALLRTYRVGAGLSQEELAERAHLSQRTVSDLERGVTSAPYRETVTLLADALELTEPDRADLEDAVDRSRTSTTAHQEPDPWASDPLLATKLAAPVPRPSLVERTGLIERLSTGLRGPLTLLCAPAGSGKTTSLGAWRATAGRDVPLAWISLDSGDNDPARFWRYVLAALGRAYPDVGQITEDLLASPQLPSPTSLLTRLINAITAANVDLVLALDDYHLIEHDDIHEGIAFLLDHLPPSFHLLLSSRADPPLPLARLRATGAVTEVRATDLRFSVEEAGIFFREIMDLPLPHDAVAVLEARTEGWIAGLQLAALSLRGRPIESIESFVAAFAGSHRYIVDYLVDEVLARQPETVQRFLLHTCILDRLSAPLGAAVIDGETPLAERVIAVQETLEQLERDNVFLIALDDERRWYRYHHLFADALRQRQTSCVPDASFLHDRASVWLEQEGLLREAVGHALAAEDYDRAADLVTKVAPALLSSWEFETFAAWFRALPESVRRSRPQICVMHAWFLVDDARDLDLAEHYLQQAEAALDTWLPEEAQNLRGEIAAARAGIVGWYGDASGAIEQAELALRDLDDSNVTTRSLATFNLGVAQMIQGAARDAAVAFQAAALANRATNNAYAALMAAMSEVHAYRALGAWTRALSICEEAISWSAERSHPSPIVGILNITLADLLRERGQLDAALTQVTHGIDLCADLGAAHRGHFPHWRLFGRLLLARISLARGDLDGSLEIIGREREQLAGRTASFAALLDALEAQVHLTSGDVEAAERWVLHAEAHWASPHPDLSPFFSFYVDELIDVASVRVLIAQGRGARDAAPLNRALELVDTQRREAERLGFHWRYVKTLALRALALDALGHRDNAADALEQALLLAQPEGYVGLFMDEGPPMTALLREVSARTTVAGCVAALLSARESKQVPEMPPAVASRGGLAEPLTERELDVLRLLAVGQSNPEIARTLYVEVNTVKTHVKTLYGKLGVHSRVEAVHRARELTLL
jgi:LuxR family maltose regulon positive regulatory protein